MGKITKVIGCEISGIFGKDLEKQVYEQLISKVTKYLRENDLELHKENIKFKEERNKDSNSGAYLVKAIITYWI